MSDEEHQRHDQRWGALGGIGGGQECCSCPVCTLLHAARTARPEVMRHVLAAGRELSLALQALMTQHVEAGGEPGTRPGGDTGDAGGAADGVERIDVD